jgi:F-type H+-transporting ATPase subunit gamma
MTRRRDIMQHLRSLGEIREIMSAMRNLALLETRKLARVVPEQERVVGSIRAAMVDVLSSFPQLIGAAAAPHDVLVVVGSERGFCGDFNRALLASLQEMDEAAGVPVIAVGQRLASRMPASRALLASLPGATTTEEVPDVLLRLVRALGQRHDGAEVSRSLRPVVLYQGSAGQVVKTVLDPAADGGAPMKRPAYPPGMNLPPEALLGRLTEHYLYAMLCHIFYGSLAAENERRMRHMENALNRIDEQTGQLRRRCNGLRQEEITEEIEVITLNTG